MSTEELPTVYILSDSLGETADQVAKAILSQFDEGVFNIVRLPRVSSRGQLQGLLRGASAKPCVFVYTLATPKLRVEMDMLVRQMGVAAVDVIGPGIEAFGHLADAEPAWMAGMTRRTDRGYFERVEALEFAVKHDDGRNVEELTEAEIVLIGVSRTSKTPLSMYLAFKGYRVANIPLMVEVPPPPQLMEIDRRRVFGLVCSPDLLVEIRSQRVSDLGVYARRYADRSAVEEELEASRDVMRRIGCIVVSSEGRAIEETAQEILRHLRAHGLGLSG